MTFGAGAVTGGEEGVPTADAAAPTPTAAQRAEPAQASLTIGGLVRLFTTNTTFAFMYTGMAVSYMGDSFAFVGHALLVDQVAPGGLALAVLMALRLVPLMLFSSLGGVLADKFPKPLILLLMDLARVVIAPMYLLARPAHSAYPMYAASLLQFMCSGVFDPTAQALVPELVPHHDILLATWVDSVCWSMMTFVGSALGGWAISAYGAPDIAIWGDSLTYAVSAACMWRVRRDVRRGLAKGVLAADGKQDNDSIQLQEVRPLMQDPAGGRAGGEDAGGGAPVDDDDGFIGAEDAALLTPEPASPGDHSKSRMFVDGLKYLQQHRRVAVLAFIKACDAVVYGGIELLSIRFIESSDRIDDAVGLSLYYALIGLCSGFAPIIAARYTPSTVAGMKHAIGYCFLLASVSALMFLASVHSLPMLFIASMTRASANGVNWVFSSTLLQLVIPDHAFRGRVLGFEILFLYAAQIFGIVMAGVLTGAMAIDVPHVAIIYILVSAAWAVLWNAWFAAERRWLEPMPTASAPAAGSLGQEMSEVFSLADDSSTSGDAGDDRDDDCDGDDDVAAADDVSVTTTIPVRNEDVYKDD